LGIEGVRVVIDFGANPVSHEPENDEGKKKGEADQGGEGNFFKNRQGILQGLEIIGLRATSDENNKKGADRYS
jgi:hypothetical protein